MKKSMRKQITSALLLKFIGKPSPLEEMRKTFYRVVIVNMFWIDSDLPQDPDQKFELALNPNWANDPNPDNYLGLRHMSEELLIYVCSRFKRPRWVTDSTAVKVNMSLNDIVRAWPFLFDLADKDV
jgi:hypothetical protein